jgi:hypothetical protein
VVYSFKKIKQDTNAKWLLLWFVLSCTSTYNAPFINSWTTNLPAVIGQQVNCSEVVDGIQI